MTRVGPLFWLGLVAASGFATYSVKYFVQGVDDQLQRVQKQTIAEQQEIRVLAAQWTYENQPERLADLNQRFLHLAPISAKQLQQRIADIPSRAPDAVPAAPPAVVASGVAAGAAAPVAVASTLPDEVRAPGLVIGADPAVAAASLQQPQPPLASAQKPRPPVAVAALAPAPGDALVRLAATAPVARPATLDALFSQVAEK